MIDDKEGEGGIILYESNDGKLKINVRLEDETTWLTQQQLAELFQTSKQLVSHHISNIFKEGELSEGAVVKKSLTTAADGKNTRQITTIST